jgi:hypothetical protein
MGCKRGVGKVSEGQEELAGLEEDDDDGLADRLVNLPVAGSRYDLLIKEVAGGNQCLMRKEDKTLDLPH